MGALHLPRLPRRMGMSWTVTDTRPQAKSPNGVTASVPGRPVRADIASTVATFRHGVQCSILTSSSSWVVLMGRNSRISGVAAPGRVSGVEHVCDVYREERCAGICRMAESVANSSYPEWAERNPRTPVNRPLPVGGSLRHALCAVGIPRPRRRFPRWWEVTEFKGADAELEHIS